jgi:hypothetical protein
MAHHLARRAVLAVAIVTLSLAACGGESSPPASGTEPGRPTATVDAASPAATDDLVVSIARGPWRQRPVEVSLEFSQPFEAGCRVAEPGIAELPVAVVDVRGGGLVTIVFGEAMVGVVCWSPLESPEAPLEIRSLGVAAAPVDGIDPRLYDRDQIGGDARVVAIGRIGPLSKPRPVLGDQVPAKAIAQLSGEAFIWAAFDGGWYSLWWPGVESTGGITATNGRNEVLMTVSPELP